jgi:hypothetical protein
VTYGYTKIQDRDEAVRKLALAFSRTLWTWLRTERMTEVIQRNRAQADKSICHSHDFCDANMAMDAAFQEVLGDSYLNFGPAEEELWDPAWDLAKANDFDPAKLG